MVFIGGKVKYAGLKRSHRKEILVNRRKLSNSLNFRPADVLPLESESRITGVRIIMWLLFGERLILSNALIH